MRLGLLGKIEGVASDAGCDDGQFLGSYTLTLQADSDSEPLSVSRTVSPWDPAAFFCRPSCFLPLRCR